MNSNCFFRSSSRTEKPRSRAVVKARIGSAWLWQAKQVLSATCPSAPLSSSGSVLPTASRTFSGEDAGGWSFIAAGRPHYCGSMSVVKPCAILISVPWLTVQANLCVTVSTSPAADG
jgi:hypothetical protein